MSPSPADVPALAALGMVECAIVNFSKLGQQRVWPAGSVPPVRAAWSGDGRADATPSPLAPQPPHGVPAHGPAGWETQQQQQPHHVPPSMPHPSLQQHSMGWSLPVQQMPHAAAHHQAGMPVPPPHFADRSARNRPCATLFVSRMPPAATEETVRSLFPGALRIFCSKKPLREDEHRTAFVSFASVDVAAAEIERMNNFCIEPQRPISVGFSHKEQDQQPAGLGGYGSGGQRNVMPRCEPPPHYAGLGAADYGFGPQGPSFA